MVFIPKSTLNIYIYRYVCVCVCMCEIIIITIVTAILALVLNSYQNSFDTVYDISCIIFIRIGSFNIH